MSTQSFIESLSEAKPDWEKKIPWFSYDNCPQFDGKRCRYTASTPSGICEPMFNTLERYLT
jgi:hypothetical protein